MPARTLVLILLGLGLVACKAVGPNFMAPNEPVPGQYAGGANDSAAAPRTSADSPPPSFWWRQFRDPELDRLEELAAAGNLDLKTAFLRLVQARIEVQSARAQGLPSLNA